MKNFVSDTWNCTTREDAEEAIKVANFLDIELKVFDYQKEYEEHIIQYIFDGYECWITPNPDILCNNLVKFKLFLDDALLQWFDAIATGHYSRIQKDWNSYNLLRWKDRNKDQSYFLSWLNQYQLSNSIFPLWALEKTEIRKIAKEKWLPNADRKDSQGLCFIGNIPMKEFLLKKLNKKEGNIIDIKWNIVGKHDWAYFFTIWQRHGLKLPFKAFVIKTNIEDNTVTVWEKEHQQLHTDLVKLQDWNRINSSYKLPLDISAKIRYRQTPAPAQLIKDDQHYAIKFKEEQFAIAPWQTAVAYLDDICIWNGIIQ
jgi:tRNA-specific 2-thiouridylase